MAGSSIRPRRRFAVVRRELLKDGVNRRRLALAPIPIPAREAICAPLAATRDMQSAMP